MGEQQVSIEGLSWNNNNVVINETPLMNLWTPAFAGVTSCFFSSFPRRRDSRAVLKRNDRGLTLFPSS